MLLHKNDFFLYWTRGRHSPYTYSIGIIDDWENSGINQSEHISTIKKYFSSESERFCEQEL